MMLVGKTLLPIAVVVGMSSCGTPDKQASLLSAPVSDKPGCVCAKNVDEETMDAKKQTEEYERQAKTLFGEWERISADTDIGFSHEQIFGNGVRLAPKSFFLWDPDPGRYWYLYWSWNKFDGHRDHAGGLIIDDPKDSLPRAFIVQTGYVTIRFHVLSSGNRAEIWVTSPWYYENSAIREFLGIENGNKIILAGYYSQKDNVNRFEPSGEVEVPMIQARPLEDILKESREKAIPAPPATLPSPSHARPIPDE